MITQYELNWMKRHKNNSLVWCGIYMSLDANNSLDQYGYKLNLYLTGDENNSLVWYECGHCQ